MNHDRRLPRCGNCGTEIPWKPVVHQGRPFCCGGCARGGPCYCSYDLAPRDQPRASDAVAAPGGGRGTAIGDAVRKADAGR